MSAFTESFGDFNRHNGPRSDHGKGNEKGLQELSTQLDITNSQARATQDRLNTHISESWETAHGGHLLKEKLLQMQGVLDQYGPASLDYKIAVLREALGNLDRQFNGTRPVRQVLDEISQALQDKVNTADIADVVREEQLSETDAALSDAIDAIDMLTQWVNDMSQLLQGADGVEQNWDDVMDAALDSASKEELLAVANDLASILSCFAMKHGVDFRNWKTVRAVPKAVRSTYVPGRGPEYVYLIARLSEDFSDSDGKPNRDFNDNKAATCYIKYVDGHPFDSIVQALCSGMSDDDITASIMAIINRAKPEFPMSIGLYKASYEVGDPQAGRYDIYIGIKDKELFNDVYADLNVYGDELAPVSFLVSGINCVPLEEQRVIGQYVERLCEVTSNAGDRRTLGMNTSLSLVSLSTPGDRIIVTTGDGKHHELAYTDDDGSGAMAEYDAIVGACIRWPSFLAMPDKYLKCDGSIVAANDYQDLALAYGLMPNGSGVYAGTIQLPMDEGSIIRVQK